MNMFAFTIDLLDNSPRLDKPNIIQFGWLLSALLIVILCAIIDNQGKLRHWDWCWSFIYYLQPRRRMNDPSRTCSFVHEKMLTKTPSCGKDWAQCWDCLDSAGIFRPNIKTKQIGLIWALTYVHTCSTRPIDAANRCKYKFLGEL